MFKDFLLILLGAVAVWLPRADFDAAYKFFHPGAIKVNGIYYQAKAGADPITVTWPDGSVHSAPAAPGMVIYKKLE